MAIPLRIRREHSDWSNAEHAAWLDLLIASYPLNGVIESLEVARAYLGQRSAALPALVERGAFVEVEDGWQLVDYIAIYDETKQRRSNVERVATAIAKQKRGEPLTEAERKAIQRAKSKEAEKDKKQIRVDVTDMSGRHVTDIGTTNLYELYHHLTGHARSPQVDRWIDGLCKEAGGRPPVRQAMLADPNPRQDGFLERVRDRLRGVAA